MRRLPRRRPRRSRTSARSRSSPPSSRTTSTLSKAPGGTIGILTGPDGVFMVDTQYAQLTEKIVAAIKQITPAPIRFMVNTHVHPDHTGGNENFAKLGVVLLSSDQAADPSRRRRPSRAASGARHDHV
ncbi:MAG: MBL fold metallo-hydrolase [Vicinamibacterales bacterium]